MRFQVFNLAERALLDNLLNAEEIAVPAAVVEDGEQQLLFIRQRNQVAGFLHVEGKRLIDDHVFTRVQGQRRQRGVRGVGGGNHHQIDIRMLNSFFRCRHYLYVRQIAFNLLFITRRDHGQLNPVHRLDQRGMEGFTDKSIPDQRNVDCLNFTHDLLHVNSRTP